MKSLNYKLLGLLLIIYNGVTIVSSQSGMQSNFVSNSSAKVLVNLYKCKCKADQVLMEDTCLNKDNTTLTVYNKELKQWIQMATYEFGNISVRDITCRNGTVPFIIEFSLFLDDRLLYDLENDRSFDPESFCFEHIENGNNTRVSSKICQHIPSVPQCCNKGFILDSNSICSYDGFSFNPPFKTRQTFETIYGDASMINKCSEGYDLQVANISDLQSSTFLVLSETNEAILHKESLEFEVEQNINSSEFCVGARKHKYGFYYEAYYCKKNNTFHHEQMCKSSSCSRKCCPIDSVFSMNFMTCVKSNSGNVTIPRIMTRSGFYSTDPGDMEPKQRIITGPPLCSSFLTIAKDAKESLTIDGNGFLQVRTILTQFTPRSYCIENIEHENGTEETVFVCSELLSDSDCHWRYTLISILLGVSSLFLLISFVSYLSLQELREKISGKCLISEVTSLFIAYILLIILHTRGFKLSFDSCRVTGTIEYIFALASFFWLNVMCFDMWTTIRSHRPVDDDHGSRTRFILYSVYGWGVPLLFGVLAIVIDSLPYTSDNSNIIRPGFGLKSCYFADNESKWAYLYGVILVLLIVNFGFFIHIVIILMKAQKDNKKMFTDQSRSPGGNKDASKERCLMYVKLFVVMGISWFTEVISAQTENSYPKLCYVWLPTDIINALRGVLIFIIFVCKKTTMKKIYNKWCGEFAKRRRLSFLKWSSHQSEPATRSSNISSGTFSSIRRKDTPHSSSYKKNIIDSLSMSEIPEQEQENEGNDYVEVKQ